MLYHAKNILCTYDSLHYRPTLWIINFFLRAGPSRMPLRSWYNCGTNHFHQADFCLAEMKKPTVLSNKCSSALSCAEDQMFVEFLREKSSEQDFEYLYWTISKILFWSAFTWKETYMIDWVVVACSRLLKMIRLFCRIPSLLWGSFAKETYMIDWVGRFHGGLTIYSLDVRFDPTTWVNSSCCLPS